LTKKQRLLIRELDEITSTIGIDYWIFSDMPNEERTVRLELVKKQIIRGEILMRYVLLDELLNDVMCWHVFGRQKKFIRLWRTKKFKAFNYFILEKLYLIQKIEYVKFIHRIPKSIENDIYSLNNLRNAIAHSFFPENRKSKPFWKGKDIFSIEGFKAFEDDVQTAIDFFFERFWKASPG